MAALVDWSLLYALGFSLAVFSDSLNATEGVQALVALGGVGISWFCLLPLLEGVFGFSLGKGLLDLKVVTETGTPIGLGRALQRHILDPVDLSCSGLVAVLVALNTPKAQRIGDLWAKTVVVHERCVREDEETDS